MSEYLKQELQSFGGSENMSMQNFTTALWIVSEWNQFSSLILNGLNIVKIVSPRTKFSKLLFLSEIVRYAHQNFRTNSKDLKPCLCKISWQYYE
jgi:hypothetical protein